MKISGEIYDQIPEILVLLQSLFFFVFDADLGCNQETIFDFIKNIII